MLLGVVAQAQNFAITATTEAAVRKNIVKGNAANYGFGMINDTLKLIGLTTRNVIFTGTIGKSGVGLGFVDNTSDANKPVSTATQTQLNLKQNQLNGTGFVKASGTTISYDNSTYLSTSSAASTYLPIANPTATGTLTVPGILTGTSVNSGAFTLRNLQSSAFVNDFIIQGNSTNTYLGNYQNFPLGLYTNNTERVRIFANGRVGINTTTDAGYLLDVNGTGRFVNGVNLATTSGNVGIGTISPTSLLHIYSNVQTNTPSSTVGIFKIENSVTNAIIFGTLATSPFATYIQSGGTGLYPLGINPLGGNVGIGTTSPTSKLQVVDFPVYATNAAAVTAGLTAGAFYRTSVGVLMVVY